MRTLIRRWAVRRAALAVGIALAGAIVAQGGAEPAPSLRAQAAAIARNEADAVLQLYAAESSLARAHGELAQLETRLAVTERAEGDARRRAEIVQRSLRASQDRVASLLRALYVQGETDPIAVIFGANSLGEALAAIDGLERATALNRRLGSQAAQRARRLAQLRGELADRRASLADARTAARQGTERLTAAVEGRRSTVSQLRRQAALTSQKIAALQARARDAQRRSTEIAAAAASDVEASPDTREATPTPEPAAPAPVSGTRTLVVNVVAYHLPGRTASGLPVGIGVVAVDPNVIPLGTRVFVPGYGPAVAADVGPGVRGNIIDVWLPSTAQARAWGLKRITITVYG